jgi:glycosyltransferase involved in cell wall biosynthesis
MRLGQNPAKYIDTVAQPAAVTLTVVSCIPLLSGYHEHSLEVLKACLASMRENAEIAFDLMVFDNHSCRQVRTYLADSYDQGLIQYLVLSDRNIGKTGAWNFMFGAAQGEYVGYADSDVYFHRGWLKASLGLFEAFPKTGMVTARPLRTQVKLSTATTAWAQRSGVRLEEGRLIEWQAYAEHEMSLGHSEEQVRAAYESGSDIRLSYKGKRAYVGAGHFQFLARKQALGQVMPLPSKKPMRDMNTIEGKLNDLGYLRLCTEEPLVSHMGNQVPSWLRPARLLRRQRPLLKQLLWSRPVRYVLLGAYSNIFRWYFENVD